MTPSLQVQGTPILSVLARLAAEAKVGAGSLGCGGAACA